MSLSSELFLYIAYLIALVEVTLGLYALVTNPRRTVNQIIAILLLVFAINSLGIGLLQKAQYDWESTFPTALLAASTLALQPLLIITDLIS